jgi:hypothetical protein
MKPLVNFSLAALVAVLVAPAIKAQQATPTVNEIVSRNIAARGGSDAWRAVQAISMSGKMQAGGNSRPTLPMTGPHVPQHMTPKRPLEQVELPFVMDLKRSRKQRIEVQFNGQTSVQVYDGASGWLLRPYLNRTDYEPYSDEQLKAASEQSDLDGPLFDYAAKGNKIALAGTEKVEDRDTYKLAVTLKNGYSFHLWIDAKTFLEAKMEGSPRRLDGKERPVEIYYRDFRRVGNLVIPYTLETRVLSSMTVPGHTGPQWISEAISIDKVEVNPKLEESLFTRPAAEVASSVAPQGAAAGRKVQ